MFRSVLEHHLKIRERIVDDLVVNLKNEASLDVNLISNSFKNHVDYIAMLRKLMLYFE